MFRHYRVRGTIVLAMATLVCVAHTTNAQLASASPEFSSSGEFNLWHEHHDQLYLSRNHNDRLQLKHDEQISST